MWPNPPPHSPFGRPAGGPPRRPWEVPPGDVRDSDGVPIFIIGLLAIALVPLLLSLAGFQLTTRQAAGRALERIVATVSEIDLLLADSYELMIAEADGEPGEVVRVPDMAVPVWVTGSELMQLSQEELRSLILERSAQRLYDQGPSAFGEGTGGTEAAGIGLFSAPEALTTAIQFLRSGPHSFFTVSTLVFLALAVVLALLLLARIRSLAALAALGGTLAAVALLLAAAAWLLRLVIGIFADAQADPVGEELLKLAHDMALVPIRDYLILAALGLVLVALAVLLRAATGRLSRAQPASRFGQD